LARVYWFFFDNSVFLFVQPTNKTAEQIELGFKEIGTSPYSISHYIYRPIYLCLWPEQDSVANTTDCHRVACFLLACRTPAEFWIQNSHFSQSFSSIAEVLICLKFALFQNIISEMN